MWERTEASVLLVTRTRQGCLETRNSLILSQIPRASSLSVCPPHDSADHDHEGRSSGSPSPAPYPHHSSHPSQPRRGAELSPTDAGPDLALLLCPQPLHTLPRSLGTGLKPCSPQAWVQPLALPLAVAPQQMAVGIKAGKGPERTSVGFKGVLKEKLLILKSEPR